MTGLERYVGQILDEKYRLERLLGQGGMGAVYLAAHLGTERYVALKIIAPQFMRNEEFVERFKREARAAGRLRHPNVVDVTDFGFARAGDDRVAYLVMEYLDGCTLGDVLAEEERLPLYWVVDILEQVCSAVHEAHQQGIVHRDLKPDNIWLEPNRLGGYRIKVLDFGIAKLAEADGAVGDPPGATESTRLSPSAAGLARAAVSLETDTILYADAVNSQPDAQEHQSSSENEQVEISGDVVDERRAQAAIETDETRLFVAPAAAAAATMRAPVQPHTTGETDNGAETRIFDELARRTRAAGQQTAAALGVSTGGLTRVGAIMGTPQYMSPEQCRGERLDARSDIYSLGIIAYQMLSGAPPFSGDMTTVMRAHNEDAPPPLRVQKRKLPKRAARLVMTALAKDPAERPQTAAAFANALRANADGLGALYRRAFALYSEYFPKFLKLSLLAHIPVIIVTLAMLALRLFESRLSKLSTILIAVPIGLLQIVATFVTASIISGVTAIIVTQLAVAPLKPVELHAAFAVLRRRWRPFLRTGIRISVRILLGWCLLVIPGMVMTVRYLLWAPVVLMEGLEKKAARLRARSLASRSWRTIILVSMIQILVPMLVGGTVGVVSGATSQPHPTMRVKIGTQLSVLVNIFVLPLMSIVPALLYLKMRQMGGETLNDVAAQLEDSECARSQWQQRMRTRLSVHTPHKPS